MITQCKNCAGQLVFDPAKQMLVCDHCGSEFRPEEFTAEETAEEPGTVEIAAEDAEEAAEEAEDTSN